MFELDAEQPAGKLFQNGSGNFYAVLFAHRPPSWDMGGADRPERGRSANSLGHRDVGRLQTLGALRHFEFHSSAFIQGSVSLRLNSREVHEDVLSVLTLDKAVALRCVKPLHCTF